MEGELRIPHPIVVSEVLEVCKYYEAECGDHVYYDVVVRFLAKRKNIDPHEAGLLFKKTEGWEYKSRKEKGKEHIQKFRKSEEKRIMEVNRIQIRLNPKKERDQKVIEKLSQTDKTQRDYVLEAILAYQEQSVLGEDTLRRILREELQHTGIRTEALQETGQMDASQKVEKKQTEPILPDVKEEQNPMGEKAMSLLTAFDSMD